MNQTKYPLITKKELLALFVPIVALALHSAAWPFVKPHIWFAFYTSLYISARIGGERGGMYATFFTAILVYLFELKPILGLVKTNFGDYVSMVFFIFIGIVFAKTQGKLDAQLRELKISNQKLKENKEHLESIINNGPECIKIIDSNGRLLRMNPACLEMIEATSIEQIAGKSILEIVAPEYRAEYEAMHKRVLAGELMHIEYETIGLKGGRRHLETTAAPMEEDGRIVHLAVTRDITEKKIMEENLRSINRHLHETIKAETEKRLEQERLLIQQSKMASMGEMVGAIGHQWRQPLNALGLYIQDLPMAYKFGELDEKYLENYKATTMDLIKNMSSTIDDFRNFFSTNKQEEEFTVEDSINDVLKILAAQLKINNIEVVFNQDSEHKYRCYKNELKQVFLNIIANAKDALLKKKTGSLIKIDINKTDDALSISIEDSAGGIPENIMDKIFDPHFTTKSADKGTGIGLYMSKEIVENSLRGKLLVENTENGAKFTVELPIKI